MTTTIRLMTHNVWNCNDNLPAWKEKGFDCSAEARLPGLMRVYRELMPDVIGCQEVTKKIAGLLQDAFTAEGDLYAMVGDGYTPIFYRKDRLSVIESEFFRYSEKMDGFDGIFNDAGSKSYSIAVFESKESGKRFVFASTHLWWMRSPEAGMRPPYPSGVQEHSNEARAYQLGLLRERLRHFEKRYDAPIFIVGDLNDGYNSTALQEALKSGYLHAHDIATDFAEEAVGYHYCFGDGFKTEYYDKPFEWAIDHILARNLKDTGIRRFERYSPDYYFPISDHSPAYIDYSL